MKKYILTGKPSEVEKVIRENRIRIGRGDIIITPLQDEEVPENPDKPEGKEIDLDIDDKILEVEDLKEIDLDIDDKTIETDDSKDVPAPDTKDTKTAKKTSKRTKKSE